MSRLLPRTLAVCLLLMVLVGSALGQVAESATDPTPTVFEDTPLVQQYQATITPDDLAAHLYFFASDHFEGRETATRGQKMAAGYLAAQYRKLGARPAQPPAAAAPLAPEAYLQPFTVYGRAFGDGALTLMHGADTVAARRFTPAQPGTDAYYVWGNGAQREGGLVFAGYGISDAELGYDDYAALANAGLSSAGQWLLILDDEPLASAETSLLPTEDGAPSAWSTNLFQKIRAAFQAGAPRGILIVGDTGPRAPESLAAEAAIAMEGAAKPQGSVSLEPPAAGLAYPPLFVISSELADQLLASTGRTVAELKADIDADLQPTVLAVEDARVSSRLTFETVPLGTENVVAYIEGSDPVLKDEVVVLSAHYDHIGIKPGTEGDRINNGADDDGSGTVALLEIAEAFQTAKENGHGPRRSVVFLNVSGEEKGLLGSAYYADTEPLFPLEQTVANLNIDMIGRYDPTHPTGSENYVYIIGSNLISQELHDLNLRVNEVTGIGLELDERFNSKDDPNQFYRRSDHWNFGKHGIPFIFFFTGTHEDYHDVGDEPQKIDYDRLARITRLVFGTAWQVANQDDPPAVSGTGFN